MSDCIFCKIVNGEFNTEFVYETENVVVFKDINPVAPVHLLVVPKKHYSNLSEVDYRRRLFIDLIAEPRGWKFTEIVTSDTAQERKEWLALQAERDKR